MQSGKQYQGFLRWGREEAFWDDLFHSGKEDLPYLNDRDRNDRNRDRDDDDDDRGSSFDVFKWRIHWRDHNSETRMFIARFGDIAEIRVTGGDDAEITMKDGKIYEVEGVSNDVGGTIHVKDPDMGDIDLKWKRIETIRFLQAPADARPPAYRLYGVAETSEGEFEGFVQWDKQECLSSDILDGESEDGDMKLKMGRLRSIERRSRSAADVEFKDGRTLTLRGTNDVNNENRGIMIEDARFGRVTIPWSEFDKLTFREVASSGRNYASYQRSKELTGTVTDRHGESFSGRIVLDLDEAATWEILNGSVREIAFDIPLSLVASIEPVDDEEAIITFLAGETLTLEAGQDVTDRNDGMLVFSSDVDDDPVYLEWDEVKRIEFHR
jgi:hypothetical protein